MNLALGIVALIAAVVVLATKVVDLWSSILKFRSEHPKTAAIADSASPGTQSHKHSKSEWFDILLDLFSLFVLLLSYFLMLMLFFSKGPATKQDVAVIGFVVVVCTVAFSTHGRR
ncbi:MAG TPA: hypothetical protein VMP11_18585 [Verrucomicrobiae bacterium]|nr:hypothetical protein [Verrucomicrobiae bacterium]